MNRLHFVFGALFTALVVLPAAGAEIERTLEIGVLEVVWGDPQLNELDRSVRRVSLRSADGEALVLQVEGPLPRNLYGMVGRRVEVTVERESPTAPARLRFIRPLPLRPGESSLGGAVTGSQPWVSLLCKFSDVSNEPENLTFFQGMYDNTPGRLDHYWREQSYGLIDVVGSTAIAWVDLPSPQSTYVPTPGSNQDANLNLLFNDCTSAADPLVDFGNGGTAFVGINLMFNHLLDCCAWGGSRSATLDGITKSWRVTWNPPWSFADEGVIAHEMGHGFGLPHSNNFDGDTNPYDSVWDMMSSAVGFAVADPTYGRLGKHTLSYHKDRLAWIAGARLFEPMVDGVYTITIDRLSIDSTSNYLMARLTPPVGTTYYTVEVRKRVGDYDGNLAGDAVIISEINNGRSQPAWVVDADVPPAGTNSNEGSMWKVGESFSDPSGAINVQILSETTEGFVVKIINGTAAMIFEDGFESGNTSAW